MKMILYTLLPIIFMFHEFEEILFFKTWLHKDKNYLHNRFPKIGARIYSQYKDFTTAGFVFAIAEEFVLISILTHTAIVFQKEYLWFTAFMGFSIHLVIHILQWIFYRKYVPMIVTSILSLPYTVYGFVYFIMNNEVNVFWIIVSSFIGIVVVILNLRFIHYLGHRFSIWEQRLLAENNNAN